MECLDEGPLLRGVLIYAPITGGVAPALARALHYRREKMRRDRPTPSVFLESDVCICIGCVMDTPRVRMRSRRSQARPRRTLEVGDRQPCRPGAGVIVAVDAAGAGAAAGSASCAARCGRCCRPLDRPRRHSRRSGAPATSPASPAAAAARRGARSRRRRRRPCRRRSSARTSCRRSRLSAQEK